MGWLWNSKPVTSAGAQPAAPSTQNEVSEAPVATAVSAVEPVKQPLSRDEQSNRDLAELMKELQAEINNDPHKSASKHSGQNPPLKQSVPVPDVISPDSLYPTELSCRSALDYAMFCQSFGGQFVNIYRYGSFRSCSNHWDDFWVCMRTRNWEDKVRSKAIQDHYRKKAVKYKTGPSSEDVWEVREVPVRDAFQGDFEALEAKIAEWKKANPDAPDPWKITKGPQFGGHAGAP